MNLALSLENLGKRETSTVTGSTVKRLFGASNATGNSPLRKGVQVCNHSPAYALRLKLVAKNATLPTVSASDFDYLVLPGSTVLIPVGEGIDVCALNSSGASGTAAYSALEVF